MVCQLSHCVNAASIMVQVAFKPGGQELLRVCHHHAWEFYALMAAWQAGKGIQGLKDVAQKDYEATKNTLKPDH